MRQTPETTATHGPPEPGHASPAKPPQRATVRRSQAVLLAVGALLAFGVLLAVVKNGGAPGWDRDLFSALYSGETTGPPGAAPNASGLLEATLPIANRVGNAAAIVMLTAATIAALAWKGRFRMATLCIAAFSLAIAAGALKTAIGREGPFESHGGVSFPSGHAIASMTIASILVIAAESTRMRVTALLVGGVAVVAAAVSVIADGGHWPSDVLGGWLLAIACVSGLVAALDVAPRRSPA